MLMTIDTIMRNKIVYKIKTKNKEIKSWNSPITKPKDEDFFRLYKEKLEEINNKK